MFWSALLKNQSIDLSLRESAVLLSDQLLNTWHKHAQHGPALQENHETLMENHFTMGSPLPSPLHLPKGWFDLYLSSQKTFLFAFRPPSPSSISQPLTEQLGQLIPVWREIPLMGQTALNTERELKSSISGDYHEDIWAEQLCLL